MQKFNDYESSGKFKFPVAICGSITRTRARHDRVRKENFLSATKWSLGSAVHRQHFESHKLAVVGMALYDFRVILVTREFRTMSCPVFFPGMSFVLVTILSDWNCFANLFSQVQAYLRTLRTLRNLLFVESIIDLIVVFNKVVEFIDNSIG